MPAGLALRSVAVAGFGAGARSGYAKAMQAGIENRIENCFQTPTFGQTRHLKQVLGIFLCLCLAAPFIGTYSWLHIEKGRVKKEIKHRMIAGIDKNELVHLKFTRVETETLLNWHHSKEFEYLGQMYDIVETKELGDSIYYWCWWDKAETALNRQLEQLAEAANGNNPKNTQQQQRLLDFQKTLFHPDAITAYVLVGSLNNIKPTTNFLMAYSLFASAPPSPPPEIRVNKILSNTA